MTSEKMVSDETNTRYMGAAHSASMIHGVTGA